MSTIPYSLRESTYNPVGATGPWGVGFPIFDPTGADIVVYLNGVEQTFGAVWTITPGTPETGFFGAAATWPNAVIYSTIPMTGELVIRGVRDPRRVPQFNEGAGVPARDQNLAFNVLTAVDQELRRDVDREVAARISDVSALDGRMTAGENKNSEQDSRLGDIDSHQIAQDGRLDGLDAEQAEQNNRIGDIENLDLGDRVIELESQITLPNGLRLATIGGLEAAIVPASADVVEVLGFQAAGDGGGFVARSVPNVGPLQPGQFHSNINLRRWENAEDTIKPAMFSDITEMFAFTKAQIQVPAKSYEFDAPIVGREGLKLRVEQGALFVPTFVQGDGERDTPLFLLKKASVDNLEFYQAAGINTVSIAAQIGDDCSIGRIALTSADYNNNNPSNVGDFNTHAAVLLRGNRIRVGSVQSENFRVALRYHTATDALVQKLYANRASLGCNIRNTNDSALLSWFIQAVPFSDQTRPWNSNGLITGENNILFSGAQNFYLGPGEGRDALEHAIRVGAGVEQINFNITVQSPRLIAPYGCGFKADDGDAHTTRKIFANDIYVEDAGRDLAPFADVPTATWGNHEAVAIRNVEEFYLDGVTTRAKNFTYCGRVGLWIEKSSGGHALNVDTQSAFESGICLQPNNVPMREVTVRGITRKNGSDGVHLRPATDSDIFNSVDVDVVSLSNVGNSYRVDDRPNGTATFAGTTRISGFGRGSAALKAIGTASAASSNFFDETRSTASKQPLTGSATYNPPSIPAGGLGATTTVTVTGAVVGDQVTVSGPGTGAAITWVGAVTAADTVTVFPINPTAAPVDPASGTIRVRVTPQA
ncbi:hypothetical protein [Bosea sp. (in: a-proteobacteria)]|uniref:hypothetical protein n=1 Tax=Bosea sp. (in: a-proteobacteria) TaxID=1871050 RepID=UPI001AC7E519|nr:hypothetical protein [Bosea sp. (in: a-proteobacteria)]MBN9438259.1 hypothetical protein [Bosea sp. (in: a-proteobacteria)]